ncbi:MAG TPA: aminotransferase class III-fold pyridoxal phosphate-dependent enzyme [Gammaproteobacteria bacterium]|jgi:acetylornithine/succinyldiaminopimelate/putrescine aminotransferase|nr:aminotransferase class III-fold pyridoxal phosphate-dependent enzyme [Gammaproteobacteria bacterium]
MSVATHEIAAVGAHLNEVYPMLPFTPVRGTGVWLENAAGRRVLDLYGGHAVAALGYGHRDLSDAIARQSRDLVFQTNALPLKVRDEAAEKLAAFGPPGLGRVFFVNSGAEANENALRLAFRVTGRTKIVAMEGSFHGRTAAAAAVTWGAAKSWYGFPRAPFDVQFVPRNDAQALAAAVDSSTAAVIIEPVQGLAGAFDFAPDFLHAIRAACDKTGALYIIDEVQTGMGRLGAPFGAQLYNVRPDLLTVAKGLGGGFPCGAVLMPHAIASELKAGALGTTFGGGPVACAAIKAVIEVIERDKLLANVRAVSDAIRAKCVVGPVESIQGKGFLLGLKTRPKAAAVRDALLARDILAGTSADPHVLRLLPPLILSTEHVERLSAVLKELTDASL